MLSYVRTHLASIKLYNKNNLLVIDFRDTRFFYTIGIRFCFLKIMVRFYVFTLEMKVVLYFDITRTHLPEHILPEHIGHLLRKDRQVCVGRSFSPASQLLNNHTETYY